MSYLNVILLQIFSTHVFKLDLTPRVNQCLLLPPYQDKSLPFHLPHLHPPDSSCWKHLGVQLTEHFYYIQEFLIHSLGLSRFMPIWATISDDFASFVFMIFTFFIILGTAPQKQPGIVALLFLVAYLPGSPSHTSS